MVESAAANGQSQEEPSVQLGIQIHTASIADLACFFERFMPAHEPKSEWLVEFQS
jgi:hypothetical protein